MNAPAPTRFLIVRHGETDANRAGLLQGWFDCPLNDLGRRQAACAADYLQDKHLDAVYTSDLRRASETADIIVARHPGLTVTADTALREWHCGVYEGLPQRDFITKYPDVVKAFIYETASPVMPEGETREEFQARVEKFFLTTAQKHAGQTVLISTHGGTIQRIFRMAAGIISPHNRLPLPDNASVSSIRYLPDIGGWVLDEWNIHEHLNGLDIHQTMVL